MADLSFLYTFACQNGSKMAMAKYLKPAPMKVRFKGPFNKKKMNQDKETIEGHHENEEVTPAGEPVSPEISAETGTIDKDLKGDDIDKLKADLAETRDKFLRIYSEFDNYKKRTQRERIDLLKTASSEVILAMLPVIDDFERAFKSAEKFKEATPVNEGFTLIYQKLFAILEQKGLKKMQSIGEEFNVDHHEAITNVPAPNESMKDKLIDEAECGYFLNDKVIRHAKVIVGN
ncbi:MAG TPA: nucleotide exchange factor GrpE [Bacteroidia bacterium]|nr:nucleotide exchange factor GrpE [Bacteroidia bacterium]